MPAQQQLGVQGSKHLQRGPTISPKPQSLRSSRVVLLWGPASLTGCTVWFGGMGEWVIGTTSLDPKVKPENLHPVPGPKP